VHVRLRNIDHSGEPAFGNLAVPDSRAQNRDERIHQVSKQHS
jgi:hypothetical protein